MKSDFEWTVVDANTFWPSDEGIPAGEEWEIYVAMPGGNNTVYVWKDEKSMPMCGESGGHFQAFPTSSMITFIPGTILAFSLNTTGFIMTKEEKLKCAVTIIIRARRIR